MAAWPRVGGSLSQLELQLLGEWEHGEHISMSSVKAQHHARSRYILRI